MSEEAEPSVYTMISSWLTPSCLFIFINLVIGTIAIASRFTNHTKKTQLARSPSLLYRFMSFNLRCNEHEAATSPHGSVVEPVAVQNHDSPGLDRVPSVRSFKEEKEEGPGHDPTQEKLTRVPSLLERIMSVRLCRSESVKGPEPESKAEDLVEDRKEEEEEAAAEEGVDAKADDFINRFRQQLRLQRLDSILRYRDMLKRN